VADVWLRVVSAAALVVFPASVGISLVAPNLVAVFFGAAWTSSTDIVRLLAPLCMVTLLGAISSVVFQAFGQLQLMVGARIGLIVLRVGLLFFLIPHLGLFGVALAMAISTTAENVALTVMALRQMRTSLFGDLVPRLWRCVLAVLAMAMGLSLLGIGWGADFEAALPGMSASFWLFGVSMLGAVIYASTLFGLWLLSGRPKGPEADMLDVAQRVLAQLRSKTRRMRGVG
jgi:O-antigen/teichoic acid export membrane protein